MERRANSNILSRRSTSAVQVAPRKLSQQRTVPYIGRFPPHLPPPCRTMRASAWRSKLSFTFKHSDEIGVRAEADRCELARFNRGDGNACFDSAAAHIAFGGILMDGPAKSIGRVPQAHCTFCDTRTPHRHERLAVRGMQVARRVCLVCNKEQARDQLSETIRGGN